MPKDNKITLLDFWAAWCGPCRVMKPIIEEIKKDYDGKLELKEIDVDQPENQPLMDKYQVQAMPTFFIERDGEVIQSFVGAQSKSVLRAALDKVLEN
ncbi:MAG TPA: thioredoxin family protein [Candidatus Saccharimonadales bacterium]|nr:thioredoxin family protein [Candidatus Saccharimonadales bacterium]